MDGPSRRTVVAGAAAAAAAVGMAAVTGCSTYGEPRTAPSSNPGSNPGSAPAPANGVLTRTSDVPVGGGLIIGASQVVVTQPKAGTFKGFTSICTHQQCQVAGVEGGTINCDCHGSRFSISDGSVVNGPATQPLPAKPITVSGGSIRLG
ncbi:MAG: Rieske (2Fe-2S) protein [Kribbellaceae bacterium]|nr:Rieske (2Fe-2S) protein [Kribbellaceae bacterium]